MSYHVSLYYSKHSSHFLFKTDLFFIVSLCLLMGMGRRATSTLRKAAKQLVFVASRSLSLLLPSSSCGSTAIVKQETCSLPHHHDQTTNISDSSSSNALPNSTQVLCAICLEPLSHSDEEAMFTGQCSHSFHFSCIASNVRHGSVTCPICRAHWTYLPCLSFAHLSGRQLDDPVLRILDDSIATFRVHRCSLLRSSHYNDDDPIDLTHSTSYPRLDFSLIPLTVSPNFVSYPCFFQSPRLHQSPYPPLQICRNAYLSVKLTNRTPIDLVLVVSPRGTHLRLLKQAMILAIFSLRPVDRLAIVTYSCVAARVFALRRMTSSGKQAALRVIDRLLYMGQTDPSQGILKGMKVLNDRAYKNPHCSVLHISSSPMRRSYCPSSVMQMGVMVHSFHVGFGNETWNGFVMNDKLGEFLENILGGVVRDIQLRIGIEGKIIRIGELTGSEERHVLLDLGVYENVCICYSYVNGDDDECMRIRGETTLSFGDMEGFKTDDLEVGGGSGDEYMNTISMRRNINRSETWDYDDPFVARRWANSLHETANL